MKPTIPQDKIFPYFKQIFAGTDEAHPLPDDWSGIDRNKTYEAPGGGIVMRPVVEGLTLMYGVDEGNTFRLVLQEMLTDWGLTEPQLFDIAIGNFGNLLSGQLEVHGDSDGVMLTVDGNTEAALILMDDIWDQLEPQIGDTLVLAVPARDVVMVTGANNDEFLQTMRDKAREIYQEGDHPLSDLLYKRVDRKWEVFEKF